MIPIKGVELAKYYGYAHGEKLDQEKSFSWYLKAAKQDDAEAQDRVGVRYLLGVRVSVDYKEA